MGETRLSRAASEWAPGRTEISERRGWWRNRRWTWNLVRNDQRASLQLGTQRTGAHGELRCARMGL